MQEGIQNVKTTGSAVNVGGDEVNQDDALMLLGFIYKGTCNGDTAGGKIVNCRQPIEKQLEASAAETPVVDNTKIGLEKAVSPECRIKTKVWNTDANGAINLKTYKKWLDTVDSEPKSTRAISSNVAVALTPVLNIKKMVTSTRWAFKVKPYRRFKARLVALG